VKAPGSTGEGHWKLGNIVLGENAPYKKVFSLFSWTGLIGVLAVLVNTAWTMYKGTRLGVSTSPAAFLTPAVPPDKPSLLYLLLSKLDVFTLWSLALWAVGLAVIYRFSMKKSAGLVLTIFGIWVVISVALGKLVGGVFAM